MIILALTVAFLGFGALCHLVGYLNGYSRAIRDYNANLKVSLEQ